MKCLGCGKDVGELAATLSSVAERGYPTIAYCSCGSTVFYEPPLHFQTGNLQVGIDNKILIPVSLPRSLAEKRDLPHLDYYVGKSSSTCEDKERFIKILQGMGACWSWECSECRTHVIEKSRREVKEGLYPLPFHPELQKLIEV